MFLNKDKVRILLMFLVGLISSLGFLILAVIIKLSLPLPYEHIGQAETYYENMSAPLLFPIAIVFGQLFGIWLTLKILREKTNYFYLIIVAAIFLTLQFFVSKVFSEEIISQLRWIYFLSLPLILAIVANRFISKQIKSDQVIKPSYFRKILKILLQFIFGLINALLINVLFDELVVSIFYMLTGGFIGDNSRYHIVGSIISTIGAPFGAFLGISLCLRLMEYKTKNLYLFLTIGLLAIAVSLLKLSFGNSFNQYMNLDYWVVSSGILTIVANIFIPKQAK